MMEPGRKRKWTTEGPRTKISVKMGCSSIQMSTVGEEGKCQVIEL